ncbi:hypothetical protein [Ktedonospora formicarum]|uniref:Lipoprotein with Yx(FWY)xxD motif n=1 Tax=Ktedonospora formicarum TaxID=2778364 RepID=A0A8J3MSP7_9CHLR|nr:hypothetical protein [Ktedonospora formicarum]GHO46345.1 hypothetical protein KSX_45080 [Ktedonospora formicarum]
MRLKTIALNTLFALLLAGILAAFGTTASAKEVSATSLKAVNASQSHKSGNSNVVVSVGLVPSHQAVGVMNPTLTTIQGMTLYIHEWHGTSGFSCDGACALTWKPFLYNGHGAPKANTKLPGKLSLGTDYLGRTMVFYQGYPLYTNVNDKVPGDYNAMEADNSPWQLAYPSVPTGL